MKQWKNMTMNKETAVQIEEYTLIFYPIIHRTLLDCVMCFSQDNC